MADAPIPQDNSLAAEKVRAFPHSPGVYLMKDGAGRVIYVGKAKDLRSRAGSYFLKAAAEEPRTARLVQEIRDKKKSAHLPKKEFQRKSLSHLGASDEELYLLLKDCDERGPINVIQ